MTKHTDCFRVDYRILATFSASQFCTSYLLNYHRDQQRSRLLESQMHQYETQGNSILASSGLYTFYDL